MQSDIEVWRRAKVLKATGRSRSTLYSEIAAGRFPKPIQLGPNSVGWLAHEVLQWLDDRIAERDTPCDASTSGTNRKKQHEVNPLPINSDNGSQTCRTNVGMVAKGRSKDE